MKRILLALTVSLAVHAAVVWALVAVRTAGTAPDVSVTLDLTNVELSFADEADATAPAAMSLPPSDPAPSAPPRPTASPPLAPEGEPLAERPPEPALEVREALTPEETVEKLSPSPESAATPEAVPQAAPRQARIDAPPRPRKTIRPEYPRGARQRGEQGDVVVELAVSARGEVDGATVVSSSGFADLDRAALEAVRKARFTPAQSSGAAVPSAARLTLNFRLRP